LCHWLIIFDFSKKNLSFAEFFFNVYLSQNCHHRIWQWLHIDPEVAD